MGRDDPGRRGWNLYRLLKERTSSSSSYSFVREDKEASDRADDVESWKSRRVEVVVGWRRRLSIIPTSRARMRRDDDDDDGVGGMVVTKARSFLLPL